MDTTTNRNRTHFNIEPSKQAFTYTREFNASRALIFRAFTEPELVARWWAPAPYKVVVEKLDARPGGQWRFLIHTQDGSEEGFHGVIHDLVAPERVVQTSEYEGAPGHVALETLTLEDLGGGKTRVTGQSVFQAVEDLEAAMAAGMQGGLERTLDQLEDLLAKL